MTIRLMTLDTLSLFLPEKVAQNMVPQAIGHFFRVKTESRKNFAPQPFLGNPVTITERNAIVITTKRRYYLQAHSVIFSAFEVYCRCFS
jgi:hypothetical protein